MALELLAGPFAVTDALGTVLLPENQQFAFYDDALGLCSYNATLDGYCIIQLDGRAYLRSNAARANRFVVDLQRPGEYLVHESLDEGMLYLFDKRAGVFGALLLSGGTNFVRDIQARALDRYLNVLNNAVRFKPLDNSGSWTTEATLSGTGSGYPAVSRTRIDGVLCLVYTDGQVVYYNVNAKAQHAGGAAISVCFCRRWIGTLIRTTLRPLPTTTCTGIHRQAFRLRQSTSGPMTILATILSGPETLTFAWHRPCPRG